MSAISRTRGHASWQDFLAAPGGALTTENHASLMVFERVVKRARERLDDICGLTAGGLPDELTAAGVALQLFNPVDGTPLLRRAVRDHGKVVTGDRALAWVASANVGDDYAVRWHDAGVRVRGDVVGEFLGDFDEIWDGVAAGVVPIRTSVVLQPPVDGVREGLPMRVVANGYDGYATWSHVRAMRVAPSRSDVGLVDWVMHQDVRRLLESGVRYYHYEGMSHRKALIADSRWVLVGSANLDAISLDTNLEVGLAIYSARFGRRATVRLVATDLRRTVRLREAPLKGWRRLVAWLAERFRDFL